MGTGGAVGEESEEPLKYLLPTVQRRQVEEGQAETESETRESVATTVEAPMTEEEEEEEIVRVQEEEMSHLCPTTGVPCFRRLHG